MTTNLQNLLEQKAALERQQRAIQDQLDVIRNKDRIEAIARIKSLMAEHGLTVPDLFVGEKIKRDKPHPSAGRRVPPKYRDPLTGATWTGRGQQPRWIKDAIANDGKTLESFTIAQQAQ